MRSTPRATDGVQRAGATYSAAADHYDAPALGFWDRFGAETIRRLAPAAGTTVLDLCCGAGGSALPAARAVGPTGHVLGLDVAEPLLDIGRRRAAHQGLRSLEFRCDDATATGLPDASFDAVVCVFGVFFAADITAFVGEMARLTRPGGTVAITTWGPALFEPANSLFWEAVGAERPELHRAYNPWDSVTTADEVRALLAAANLTDITVTSAAGRHPLTRPEDFWDIVLGSGYRATVEAMTTAERGLVRMRVLGGLRAAAVDNIRTDVLFGTGRPAYPIGR